MEGIMQLIALVICIIILISLILLDFFMWRNSIKTKDSDDCIIIRNQRRLYIRLALSSFSLIITVIYLFIFLSSGNTNNFYFSFLIPSGYIFIFLSWEYRITNEGIRPIAGYYGSVLAWNHIKGIKWQDGYDGVLIIEHKKGYTKLKIFEKKVQVADFIKKYRYIG